MITLRYGNTNTYFQNGLLIDTDMPGTISYFFKAIKENSIELGSIKYVLATHYHPDHAGLISRLMSLGVKLLLVDKQVGYVHFPDEILKRQRELEYEPINENEAVVISCEQSRAFLEKLGIKGEILPTESHSADGIALLTDDGCCFAGDLEPFSYIDGYDPDCVLKSDWERIMSHHPRHIYFGHTNDIAL